MKFVIDHDMHIHSHLSLCSDDPTQTPESILRYAKNNGYKHICLTDHFWDSLVPGASNWCSMQNLAHVSEALPLPKADGVRFDFGCEVDFTKDMKLTIARETIDKFDFVIVATSHLHMTGYTIDECDTSIERRAKLYMERNHALLDMDLPFHKMGLAHFTSRLLTYYGEGSFDQLLDYITDSEYCELFERIAKCGMGLELNLNGEELTHPSSYRPYRLARECGCKFYLGSDAHTAKHLAAAPANFATVVDALGLTEDDKFELVRGI